MTYGDLFRRHGGTVLLGYCLGFLSSFGQTFFISLSGPDIRASFGLSNGAFGTVYSVATLCSGLLMIWAGGVLDRVSTRTYAAAGLLGLSVAALGLSWAPHVAVLAVCLFGLRLFGQGMMGHAAVTAPARLPQAIRGRAVSIATLGFTTGELILPSLALLAIGTVGWTGLWSSVSFLIVVVLAGSVLVVRIRRSRGDMAPPRASGPALVLTPGAALRRRDVLRDWRFIVFIPSMVAPAAINTGYFFHQRLLGQELGWSLETLALGVAAYAMAAFVTTMITGILVDRFRAVRVCRFHLYFLAAASLLIALQDKPSAVLFFMLLGMAGAGNGVVVPAVLAELFGTERLGTIRALAGAIMVVGSATTPGLFGFVLDAHIGLGWLGGTCAVYLVCASALNWFIGPRSPIPG